VKKKSVAQFGVFFDKIWLILFKKEFGGNKKSNDYDSDVP